MATTATANPSVPTESKTARKKKTKAPNDAAPSTPEKERSGSVAGLESETKGDGTVGIENAYIKDLQKRMRSITKKLAAMAKLDTILSENPGESLDQLVAAKLINTDQKTQALKKPSLQVELASLEEALSKAKEMEGQHQTALAKERELLKRRHAKELEELQKLTEARVKLECEKAFRRHLLTFSRFLKAAAGRRGEGEEELDPEGKAFEGVLSNVYMGDVSAVEAIEKLINGVDEKARDWSGELEISYARIKELTLLEAPVDDEDPWGTKPDGPIEPPEAAIPPAAGDGAPLAYTVDLTVAHAGLTEIDDTAIIPNGALTEVEEPVALPTGTILESTGNAAAEEHWHTKPAGEVRGIEDSYEIIPRPADEVENKESATPAASTSVQSWAEEAHDAAASGRVAETNSNDGFHEVQHRGPRQHRGFGSTDRGRGRGRGGFRGRGGDRGDFRGRGRGGRGSLRGGRGD